MKIDAKQLCEALEAIEVSKGISRETVLAALEDALIRAYKKELGGDDADVRVTIDLEGGNIDMCHVLMVVKEVEDDFLEISEEDANERGDKKYIAGDEYMIPAPLATLRNATLMSIKSIMKQKFAEAERGILYEAFKDKIGTMITGRVETMDEKGASVNIGRTSVFLPRKEMIGDEKFTNGDNIKLFVNDVASGTKGAHIQVSRANEGFLKALFYEEISEIYSGAIEIKRISRQANERSKVAVYASDPNIDPAGACIGPNGSRIQKIVGQLGNGANKEKVDVIAYFDDPKLFIPEALKPAKLAGLVVNEEEKTANVVVKDDSLSLAIGKKGVNVRLAARLTGYKIDIKTETEASEQGFEYTPIEEIDSLLTAYKANRISEAQKAAVSVSSSEILPGIPEGYVAPQERVYEDEVNDIDEALLEQSETEEEEIVAPKTQEEKPAPVKEEEVSVTTVKTTTSLSDLEKSLEAESEKSARKESYKKNFKKAKKEEESEEKSVLPTSDPKNNMSIYTEEELKQQAIEDAQEAEESSYEDDDIDYDEYDDYYDDQK